MALDEGDLMKGKNPTVAEDLVAGFTELADALEAGGDIGAKFNCHQVRLGRSDDEGDQGERPFDLSPLAPD